MKDATMSMEKERGERRGREGGKERRVKIVDSSNSNYSGSFTPNCIGFWKTEVPEVAKNLLN